MISAGHNKESYNEGTIRVMCESICKAAGKQMNQRILFELNDGLADYEDAKGANAYEDCALVPD